MSAHLARARFLFERDRFAEARQELHRALQESPDDPEALALLALASAALNEIPEAFRVIQQAIGLHPDNSGLHAIQARILVDANLPQEALKCAQEAIRLNPRDPDHFALLARIKLIIDQDKAVLQATDSALQIDPEHVEALSLRTLAFARAGKNKASEKTARRALRINPDDSLSHAAQGWSNIQQGNSRQALESFREALRLDPTSEFARDGMLEALKSRYFFYRVPMRLLRWYGRNRVTQIFLLVWAIASLPLSQACGIPARYTLLLFAALVFLLLLFIAFRLFSHSTFTNILLLFDHHGRLVLGPKGTRDTIMLTVPLTVALLGLLLGIAGIKLGVSLIFPGIVSSLSLSFALSLGGWQRMLLFIGSAVVVLLSFGGAILIISDNASLLEAGKTMQGWSILAFFATWFLNRILSQSSTEP